MSLTESGQLQGSSSPKFFFWISRSTEQAKTTVSPTSPVVSMKWLEISRLAKKTTTRGPAMLMGLCRMCSTLELAMRKQQMIIPDMTLKILAMVRQKLPIMQISGRMLLVRCRNPNISRLAGQNPRLWQMVSMQQYLVRCRNVNRCQIHRVLQQQALFFSMRPKMVLRVSGMQASTCPKTIVPMCLKISLMVSIRLSQQLSSPSISLRFLQYQWMATDQQKKSESASRKPWVQRDYRMIRLRVMLGLMMLSLRVMTIPSRDTLATRQPRDMRVKKKEQRIMQGLDQKTALAIRSTGMMLLNLDLLETMVMRAARKPRMKPMPVMRGTAEFLPANLFCTQSLTKGIFCPKKLSRKITPANSIKTRNSGMQMQVAMAGMVNVVMIMMMHRAATKASASMIGITASVMAIKMLPKFWSFRFSLISSGVILVPPAEKRARKSTAPMRTRQNTQHRKSVQTRSLIGPLRHWAGVLSPRQTVSQFMVGQFEFINCEQFLFQPLALIVFLDHTLVWQARRTVQKTEIIMATYLCLRDWRCYKYQVRPLNQYKASRMLLKKIFSPCLQSVLHVGAPQKHMNTLINFDFTVQKRMANLQDYIGSEKTIDLLNKKGITSLFPIQFKTYEHIYNGKDVIAGDKTGSGKTMAFSIPVIEKLRTENAFKDSKGIKFVILAPTRELALQINTEIQTIKHDDNDFRTLAVYGGSSITGNINALADAPDIIVGTPGRMMDLIEKGCLNFKHTRVVCIDEADHMFDIGFQDIVNQIMQKIKQNSIHNLQFICFSATLNKQVTNLTQKYMRPSEKVQVKLSEEKDNHVPSTISHYYLQTSFYDKLLNIRYLIKEKANDGRVIIFTNTKADADKLSEQLGIKNVALHGDVDQKVRISRLSAFKQGKVNVLIASDVAARGLDIPNVELVINYELPRNIEGYVHRSGRTGRAGKKGISVCLTVGSNKENQDLKAIRTKTRINFKQIQIEEQDLKKYEALNEKPYETQFQPRNRNFSQNRDNKEPAYSDTDTILYDQSLSLQKADISEALKNKNIVPKNIKVFVPQDKKKQVFFVNFSSRQDAQIALDTPITLKSEHSDLLFKFRKLKIMDKKGKPKTSNF